MSKKNAIGSICLNRKTALQSQLNISDEDVKRFLVAAGGDPEKQSVGNPSKPSKGKGKEKSKVTLLYTLRTKGGSEFKLLQADTHGFWEQHQPAESLEPMQKLLASLEKVGDHATMEVLEVKLAASSSGGQEKQLDF